MEISEMDSLCQKIIEVKAEIAELEEMIKEKEASISAIKARVQDFFIESKREAPYVSPYGTLYIREDLQIRQPKGEQLKSLFEHFLQIHGEHLAWEKMSIHNQTLKSEWKDHADSLEKRGLDPLLEPLPGVEVPTKFKSLQFRKTR